MSTQFCISKNTINPTAITTIDIAKPAIMGPPGLSSGEPKYSSISLSLEKDEESNETYESSADSISVGRPGCLWLEVGVGDVESVAVDGSKSMVVSKLIAEW